jgi:hypothetical protein
VDGDGADGKPTPRALVAFTVHVYVLPAVRPNTVSGLADPVIAPVPPPLLDVHVAVKLVIALPLFAPAVKLTINGPIDVVVEPEIAFTAVGAAGEPTTTASDDNDWGPVPIKFVAATLNV